MQEPAAKDGKVEVQLGAEPSKEAAQTQWRRLQERMPALLGDRQPTFSKLVRGGKTVWRVRTGGFETEEAASQFCARVRAEGGACRPA